MLNLTSENCTREQNKFCYTIKRLNSAYIAIIIMYTPNIYQKIGYDFIRKMEEKCMWKKFVTKKSRKKYAKVKNNMKL